MSSPKPIESEILARFAESVARSLRIEPASVTPAACLSDLGAESLDLLEITMEVEDEFAIVMPQKDILHVAEEVFGPGALVQDGVLTAQGVRFLQHRIPDAATAIDAGTSLAEVGRVFQRIATWVRVIEGLLEHSPSACPSCAAALSKPVAGRMKCAACATEVDLPTGDDLNRRWVEDYHRAEQGVISDDGAQVA